MKVYIGPYKNRLISSLDKIWLKYRYGDCYYDESQTKFDKFIEWLDDRIQDFYDLTINKIIDKQERNIKIHIDEYDVWSLDHTLAIIILPCLKTLKDIKHGSPTVDEKDVPKELWPTKSDDPYHDDTVHKRWDYVLNEMIWTFEQLAHGDCEEQFYHDHGEFDFGIYELVTKREPVIDREGMAKHKDRISNGLRLFGKYYRNLWD